MTIAQKQIHAPAITDVAALRDDSGQLAYTKRQRPPPHTPARTRPSWIIAITAQLPLAIPIFAKPDIILAHHSFSWILAEAYFPSQVVKALQS